MGHVARSNHVLDCKKINSETFLSVLMVHKPMKRNHLLRDRLREKKNLWRPLSVQSIHDQVMTLHFARD